MKPGWHVFFACALLLIMPAAHAAHAEDAKFWAFQKPLRQAIPSTQTPSWAQGDLDHFVLAKLEEAGLTPSEDALPTTLLRRVHFDLIGLPPSPAALSEFSQAIARRGIDTALRGEVDRLLASPRFGERWGRHWLDVARYAESIPGRTNRGRPAAL